jgi:hypothetical protein
MGSTCTSPPDECEHDVLANVRVLLIPIVTDGGDETQDQGLTLVHFSAQPEPLLTQNTP